MSVQSAVFKTSDRDMKEEETGVVCVCSVCVCVCVRACVRACVRVCVRACVCVCVALQALFCTMCAYIWDRGWFHLLFLRQGFKLASRAFSDPLTTILSSKLILLPWVI